jgi:hypothetical protein
MTFEARIAAAAAAKQAADDAALSNATEAERAQALARRKRDRAEAAWTEISFQLGFAAANANQELKQVGIEIVQDSRKQHGDVGAMLMQVLKDGEATQVQFRVIVDGEGVARLSWGDGTVSEWPVADTTSEQVKSLIAALAEAAVGIPRPTA